MISPAANMFADWRAVLHHHARLVVHLDAEIGEGDAGPQRIAVKRRLYRSRAPSGVFGGSRPFGAAIVELRCVEVAGPHGGVEVARRVLSSVARIELELAAASSLIVAAFDRRKNRRHEQRRSIWRRRSNRRSGRAAARQPAPDRIALRPEILALVVEALARSCSRRCRRRRSRAGSTMPPSNFGARASIATAWHCVGSPTGITPWSSSMRSTSPRLYGVPRMRKLSAAVAPISLQPFEIGLEAARPRRRSCAPRISGGALDASTVAARKKPSSMSQCDDRRVIKDVDAEILRRAIERVEHRRAAAEEERVGAAEAQRAAERRLEAHALLAHPVRHSARALDASAAPAARRSGRR